MTTNFLQRAIEIVTRATELDAQKNYSEALKNYEYACEHFLTALKCACLGVVGGCRCGYFHARGIN